MTNIKDYLENLAIKASEAKETAYSEWKDADDAEMHFLGMIEEIVDEAHQNIKDALERVVGE